MGIDIHMSIIDHNTGQYIRKEIYEGRNSEWFANLTGDGYDKVYEFLPRNYGIPELVPEEIKKDVEQKFFFDFFYIRIKDFINWFYAYQPPVNAGWVTTYEKWMYENKHISPDNVDIFLPEEANINDYHFIEYVNEYEPSLWLYNYLTDNSLNEEDYIVYYFDN